MTSQQLRHAIQAIARAAGWTFTPGSHYAYGARRLIADMEQLHPGITGPGRYWPVLHVQACLRGESQPPLAWDKTLRELLERAVAKRLDPPARGPYWTPEHPVYFESLRYLRQWRDERKLSRVKLAELSGVPVWRINQLEDGGTPGASEIIALQRILQPTSSLDLAPLPPGKRAAAAAPAAPPPAGQR